MCSEVFILIKFSLLCASVVKDLIKEAPYSSTLTTWYVIVMFQGNP